MKLRKSVMQYIILFVLPLIITSMSIWASDSSLYRRYVCAIAYESVDNDTHVWITCSDNTVWEFVATPDDREALELLGENLPLGTEVTVRLHPIIHSYWIGNIDKEFNVNLAPESLDSMLTISTIQKIILQAGGWFTVEKCKYEISLSDGSVWEAKEPFESLEEALSQWKQGDHISVERVLDIYSFLQWGDLVIDKRGFNLINIDNFGANPITNAIFSEFKLIQAP